MKLSYQFITSLALLGLATSCGQTSSDHLNANIASNGASSAESLYVASGACYGGGVVTSTGNGTVAAFDPASGNLRRVVADYSQSPGDMPVAISNYDTLHILVTIENASGRRIDLVAKDGSGISTFLSNSTALSGVLHSAKLLPDGSLLVSKSTAIEKFAPSKARVLQGANSFVQAPASTCATVTTMITGIETTASGKVIFAHSAASPNNKLDVISATGYASTADCLATQTALNALAMPTAVLVHSSGKILMASGSTTASANSIYSYPFTDATNTFGTPVAAYSDSGVLVNGPSALAEDPNSTDVFVANALSTMNTIERFSFDPVGQTLTSKNSRIGPNVYTRCVSAMKAIKE